MTGLRKSLSLLVFIFAINSLSAQNGAILLSNYNESRELEDQNCAICQDEYNVMLFANRRGILTFDGQILDLVPIPIVPCSIVYDSRNKKVYVGGENNYGFLYRDDQGFYRYQSMSGDSAGIGLITNIIYTDSTIYFYGEQTISRHNIKTGNLELRLNQRNKKPFTGMFITPKNTFINVMSEGLFRLESDTLFPIVTGYLLQNDEVLFSLPYDEKMVLLGISTNSLFLFDGIKFYYYPVKDNGYLKQNILSQGICIYDSLYAFSTVDGGAMVVEKKSGKPKYTINYLLSRLPDNEIFALGTDNSNGLWLSHRYGLTRADLRLPIGNFTIYPGLTGNLISSLFYNNELYVATSEGVFYLTEAKTYKEYEILVKKEPVVNQPLVTELQNIAPVQKVQEIPTTRKGLFSRIFGKKNAAAPKKEEQAIQNIPAVTAVPAESKHVEPQYERKKVTKLESVYFMFKKIPGLNEKCKQLVPTINGILASTNKGLYVIDNHSAKAIVNDRYINFISNRPGENRYYIATTEGYFYVTTGKGGWSAVTPDKSFIQPLYSIVSTGDNTLWVGTDNATLKITNRPGGGTDSIRTYAIKNYFPQRYIVDNVNDTVFLFTESGVYFYDRSTDSLKQYLAEQRSKKAKIKYIISQPETPWIRQGDEWLNMNIGDKVENNDKAVLKIFDDVISINTDKEFIWIITGENQLFRITRNKIPALKPEIDIFIRSVKNDRDMYFKLTDIVFERGDNNVTFDLVAPWFVKQNSTQYQYIIDKLMHDWSPWTTNSTVSCMVPPGNYIIRVRAKDIWGNVTEPISKKFTIKTPFVQTTVFYILVSIVGLFIIVIIFRFREKQLQKEKHILEEKVKERTSEIEAQKQEITSSIEYASRIQMAMLPMDEFFRNNFTDYFVFFKPRDIVSGDFYWVGEDESHIFLTVADCTGHGVPGAFMSTLGISTLNEIITNKKDLHANTVLNLLREKIITALHQTGKEGEAADGMDISFCVLHKNRSSLEFAGAYNSLFICQNHEIKEYKPDRMPIGIYIGKKESFTNFDINVKKGDIIYILSDGFSDQFGGPDGTKYKKANLRKLLFGICEMPMSEQRQIIENEFEIWRGKSDQIDDVTIIGLKI